MALPELKRLTESSPNPQELSLTQKIALFADMRSRRVEFIPQEFPLDTYTAIRTTDFKGKNTYWNMIDPKRIGWVSLVLPKPMLYPTENVNFDKLPGLAVFSIDPLQTRPVTVVPELTFAEVCQSFRDLGRKPGILSFTAIANALEAQIMVIQPQYDSQDSLEVIDPDLQIPDAEVVQIVLDTFSFYGSDTNRKIKELSAIMDNPNVVIVKNTDQTVIKIPKEIFFRSLAYTGQEDFRPVTIYTPLKQAQASMLVGMDFSSITSRDGKGSIDYSRVKDWLVFTQGQAAYDDLIVRLHRENPDKNPGANPIAQLRVELTAETNHQLVNDLTKIVMAIGLIKNFTLSDTDKISPLINIINLAIEGIRTALPGYKEISAMESIALTPIDLGIELLNVLAYVEKMYSVTVIKDFDINDMQQIKAFGFSHILQPIVGNIFSNVEKVLHEDPQRAIRVRLKKSTVDNKLYYVLIFTDNGPGFNDVVLQQFGRGSEIIESDFKGTGLGSKLAKSILSIISPEITNPYNIQNVDPSGLDDLDEFRGGEVCMWFPAIN